MALATPTTTPRKIKMPLSVFGGTQFHVGSNVGSTSGPRGVHVGSTSVPRGPRRVHVELHPSTPVPSLQHASSKPSYKLATRQFQVQLQACNTPVPSPVSTLQDASSNPSSMLATRQFQAHFQACNTPMPSRVPFSLQQSKPLAKPIQPRGSVS